MTATQVLYLLCLSVRAIDTGSRPLSPDILAHKAH